MHGIYIQRTINLLLKIHSFTASSLIALKQLNYNSNKISVNRQLVRATPSQLLPHGNLELILNAIDYSKHRKIPD